MHIKNTHLKSMLDALQKSLTTEEPLDHTFYEELQTHPEYGIELIKQFAKIEGSQLAEEEYDPGVITSFHFIELCLVQLRLAREHHQRWAETLLENYQLELVNLMNANKKNDHWMPVINIFFEAGIELDETVKDTYLKLLESSHESNEHSLRQQVMLQQLLADDSDANEFDIADMFFAQTSALPAEFFPPFLQELIEFDLDKGKNVAILFLLHPDSQIREVIIKNLLSLFEQITLPPASMSRLLIIRNWLPEMHRGTIDALIAIQRKKEVSFKSVENNPIVSIHATEMDGSGAQALFFTYRREKKYQTGGLLIKRNYGVKDAWLSPRLSKAEATQYAKNSLSEELNLRRVNKNYVEKIVAHHIALAIEKNVTPEVTTLHLQELLNFQWQNHYLDIESTLNMLEKELDVTLNKKWYKGSLIRSKNWHKTRSFTSSWFEESAVLDKLVNQHCTFIKGVRHCDIDSAKRQVLDEFFDGTIRRKWLEHFIWMALWAKAAAKKNELLWKDCFTLAKLLHNDEPIENLPVMQNICEASIVISIDTMLARKTHLS